MKQSHLTANSLPDVVFITDNSHIDPKDRTPILVAKWIQDGRMFKESILAPNELVLRERIPQWHADIGEHRYVYDRTAWIPTKWLRNIVRNFQTRNLFK